MASRGGFMHAPMNNTRFSCRVFLQYSLISYLIQYNQLLSGSTSNPHTFRTSFEEVHKSTEAVRQIHTLSERLSKRSTKARRQLAAVFRIRDILVLIRILGSVPLTNGSGYGSGSGSLLFSSVTFQTLLENNCFLQIFMLISILKVHVNQYSKIKSHKKKSQNSKNQSFSIIVCLLMEGDPAPGSPKTYGSGSGCSCC